MYELCRANPLESRFDSRLEFNFASLCALFNNLLEQYLTYKHYILYYNANETTVHIHLLYNI